MSWYFSGCCEGSGTIATVVPEGPPAVGDYTYYDHESDPTYGGIASAYTSVPQAIAAGPAAGVTFGGDVDDLAIMIPVGATVAASYNVTSGVTSVALPATAVILTTTSGVYNTAVHVTDGTHTADLAAGSSNAPATLAAAGFRVVAFPGTISVPILRTLGMADAAGNLSFRWVLVPSGIGQINIRGGTTS